LSKSPSMSLPSSSITREIEISMNIHKIFHRSKDGDFRACLMVAAAAAAAGVNGLLWLLRPRWPRWRPHVCDECVDC